MQFLSTNKTSSPAAIKDFVQTLFNDQLSLVREQNDDVIQRIIHYRQQHREIFRVLLRKRNHQLLDKKENRLCQSRDYTLFR